jgi:hypothetical protein
MAKFMKIVLTRFQKTTADVHFDGPDYRAAGAMQLRYIMIFMDFTDLSYIVVHRF